MIHRITIGKQCHCVYYVLCVFPVCPVCTHTHTRTRCSSSMYVPMGADDDDATASATAIGVAVAAATDNYVMNKIL